MFSSKHPFWTKFVLKIWQLSGWAFEALVFEIHSSTQGATLVMSRVGKNSNFTKIEKSTPFLWVIQPKLDLKELLQTNWYSHIQYKRFDGWFYRLSLTWRTNKLLVFWGFSPLIYQIEYHCLNKQIKIVFFLCEQTKNVSINEKTDDSETEKASTRKVNKNIEKNKWKRSNFTKLNKIISVFMINHAF